MPLRLWDGEIERLFFRNPTSTLGISTPVVDPPDVTRQDLFFSIHAVLMAFGCIPLNISLYSVEIIYEIQQEYRAVLIVPK